MTGHLEALQRQLGAARENMRRELKTVVTIERQRAMRCERPDLAAIDRVLAELDPVVDEIRALSAGARAAEAAIATDDSNPPENEDETHEPDEVEVDHPDP